MSFITRPPLSFPRIHGDMRINGPLSATNGVANILKAAAKCKVEMFILTSSSSLILSTSMYKQAIECDEDEFPQSSSERNSISWYTRSKAGAEQQVAEYGRGVKYYNIIRPASGVVVGQDFYGAVLREFQVMAVGTERNLIDWVYVENVVLGHLLLEAKLREGKVKNGEAFYISNNEPMCSLAMYHQLGTFFLNNELVNTRLPTTLAFLFSLPWWNFVRCSRSSHLYVTLRL
jgi:sterol-4alpha-carboxylate 3-dehydrogenase (decarboxylating)